MNLLLTTITALIVFSYNSTFAQQIRTFTMNFPADVLGKELDATIIEIPENIDVQTILNDIVQNEDVVKAIYSTNDTSEADKLNTYFQNLNIPNYRLTDENIKKLEITSKVSSSEVLPRTLNSEYLSSYTPNNFNSYTNYYSPKNKELDTTESEFTTSQINRFRYLLLIRCSILGTGLFLKDTTLSVSIFAGIFNYLLGEFLYIPNKKGQMFDINLIEKIMDKSSNLGMKYLKLNRYQTKILEETSKWLALFTLNFATLVPFVGFPGSNFSEYFQKFGERELYENSFEAAIITTIFLSSFRFAMLNWSKIEHKIKVPGKKVRSKIIMYTDFYYSAVNPGFWAREPLFVAAVVGAGIAGYVTGYYYDFKNYYFRKTNKCFKFFN